jgi:pyruvate ferredoxin oxidoreductase gamma subunit
MSDLWYLGQAGLWPFDGFMFEVRIHGRGGQGVVTAAELLSVAAFLEGRHAQAFPSFGSERTGAPVVAYCRIADKPIRTREPIVAPDALIVQDPTLLHQVAVFEGLRPDGYLLINSEKPVAELDIAEVTGRLRAERLLVVPATQLAQRILGRPVPNAVLLGGIAAASGVVSVGSVTAAIRERFSGSIAERNVAAAEEAFTFVQNEIREMAHA